MTLPNFEVIHQHRDTPDDDFIEDLREVADQLGHSPTIDEYNEFGKYHASTLARRFGKWTSALKLAGLAPTRSDLNIPREDLLQNMEEVWTKLGKQPTYNVMDGPHSLFSAKTYANRFGSWSAALDAFAASVAGSASSEASLKAQPPSTPPPATAKTNSRHINWRTRFKVLQRDHFTCVSCGRSPAKDPTVELHLDHIVAWSHGGASTMDNLQTLCSVCNIGKSNLEA